MFGFNRYWNLYNAFTAAAIILSVSAFAQEKPYPLQLPKSQAVYSDAAIDVHHYDVSVQLLPETKNIAGRALIHFSPVQESAQSFIHLIGLTISSFTLNSKEHAYYREGDRIYFQPANQDTQIIDIHYSGKPGNDGYGGFHFKGDYIYTKGEGLNSIDPSMLRYWVPSHDVPDDKATLDIRITVPQAYQAFSNGKLLSVQENLDSKIFHWQETHPIATYLVALAAGPYDQFNYPYQSITGDSLLIECYVYPDVVEIARYDWRYLPDMMRAYENLLTPYPFDRYSMALAPTRGAMEHQTITTYSDQLLTGDNYYDYIVAHELAHHWFGDLVTLSDWREIWLNEGFATYSEYLYFETFQDKEFLQNYLQAYKRDYLLEVQRYGHFSIYDPLYKWGGTIYEKGALVLHMLRWQTGDEAFFDLLKQYVEKYAYKNSTISEFRSLAEQISNQDLQWFFQQWIYQPGYPDIRFQWNYEKTGNAFTVNIDSEQRQWKEFQFSIPVEIEIDTMHGTVSDTLTINSQFNNFKILVSGLPLSLTIDPDNWQLMNKQILYNAMPADVSKDDTYLAQNYPNPFRQGQKTTMVYQIGTEHSNKDIKVSIINTIGQTVKILENHFHNNGIYTTTWNGKNESGNPVASGMYFVKLESNHLILMKKILFFR